MTAEANGRPVPATSDQPSIAAALVKLARFERRAEEQDRRIEELGAQLHDLVAGVAGDGGADGEGYAPIPAPRWWSLTGDEREEAVDRLAAWAEQIFRPGYGHLAAALGACWREHTLCLYALDLLSELWAVLYLPTERNRTTLGGQAEFQTRILPAVADQLRRETDSCQQHRGAGRQP